MSIKTISFLLHYLECKSRQQIPSLLNISNIIIKYHSSSSSTFLLLNIIPWLIYNNFPFYSYIPTISIFNTTHIHILELTCITHSVPQDYAFFSNTKILFSIIAVIYQDSCSCNEIFPTIVINFNLGACRKMITILHSFNHNDNIHW